jgi:hypothetical protein
MNSQLDRSTNQKDADMAASEPIPARAYVSFDFYFLQQAAKGNN